MRTFLLFSLLLAVLTTFCLEAGAQYRDNRPSEATGTYLRDPQLKRSNLGVRGLLDPSRMDMSHSVSFGYTNIGGTGTTRGLYLNRIDYRLSNPVWLTTHLGYRFQPSGPAEWNPARNGNDFVGAADLNWKPTENSLLRLSVSRGLSAYDTGLFPYGYYGSRAYSGLP